jgi:hypothetical protein
LRETTEALVGGAMLGRAEACDPTGAFGTGGRWDGEATLGSPGSEETAAATSATPTETPSSVPRTLSAVPVPETTLFVADAPPGPASAVLPTMVA